MPKKQHSKQSNAYVTDVIAIGTYLKEDPKTTVDTMQQSITLDKSKGITKYSHPSITRNTIQKKMKQKENNKSTQEAINNEHRTNAN